MTATTSSLHLLRHRSSSTTSSSSKQQVVFSTWLPVRTITGDTPDGGSEPSNRTASRWQVLIWFDLMQIGEHGQIRQ
ncbi:hypothetical protein ACLOJK_035132 [Asimina triloba]